MFGNMLENAVNSVPGAAASVLMGFDGILVDMYDEDRAVDVETMGMEFSVLLKEVRKAAESLEVGSADEMTIRTDKLLAVMRVVNDEYFLAMALTPNGNIGKARYVLRMMAPNIKEEIV
jgi:predicted regulator of Ras-like GTPase activity (Roadblock/LC7/MglB family)